MSLYFPTIPATFIHIPKTGGVSFKSWAIDSHIPFEFDRDKKHTTLQYNLDFREDVGTTIIFVRNPFDRLVSLFHYEREKYHRKDNTLVTAFLDQGFTNFVEQLYYHNGQLMIDEKFPWMSAALPQVTWFSNREIDIVVKIENVKTDFKILQDLFNSRKTLSKFNTSSHLDYRSYYTDSTKKIVERMYQQDLDKFNYEF